MLNRYSFNFAKRVANGNPLLERTFIRVMKDTFPNIDLDDIWKVPGLSDNLRIFPAEETFDEPAFRSMLASSQLDIYKDADSDQIDHWVAMAQEIYADGV